MYHAELAFDFAALKAASMPRAYRPFGRGVTQGCMRQAGARMAGCSSKCGDGRDISVGRCINGGDGGKAVPLLGNAPCIPPLAAYQVLLDL